MAPSFCPALTRTLLQAPLYSDNSLHSPTTPTLRIFLLTHSSHLSRGLPIFLLHFPLNLSDLFSVFSSPHLYQVSGPSQPASHQSPHKAHLHTNLLPQFILPPSIHPVHPHNPPGPVVLANLQPPLLSRAMPPSPDRKVSKQEVRDLFNFFNSHLSKRAESPKHEGLDRKAFYHILHDTFNMTEDMFMDGVFKAFVKENCGFISLNDWLDGMAIFLRGTLEEKTKFCFKIYDSNGDGFIFKEEICHMMKHSLIPTFGGEDSEKSIKDLVDEVFKIMDCDHDNKISFEDFKHSVRKENLLLEAFGPCLPERQAEH
uniref:EF-hand domain-containing protein n=1 Tax=Eptatretus burgeri TaxID=7764 RepID=A0A8C4NBW5_EPTBU